MSQKKELNSQKNLELNKIEDFNIEIQLEPVFEPINISENNKDIAEIILNALKDIK